MSHSWGFFRLYPTKECVGYVVYWARYSSRFSWFWMTNRLFSSLHGRLSLFGEMQTFQMKILYWDLQWRIWHGVTDSKSLSVMNFPEIRWNDVSGKVYSLNRGGPVLSFDRSKSVYRKSTARTSVRSTVRCVSVVEAKRSELREGRSRTRSNVMGYNCREQCEDSAPLPHFSFASSSSCKPARWCASPPPLYSSITFFLPLSSHGSPLRVF